MPQSSAILLLHCEPQKLATSFMTHRISWPILLILYEWKQQQPNSTIIYNVLACLRVL